jgi:hypothetical protein
MRLVLIAIAALAFATASAAGSYKLDDKGKCHGPDGKFVKTELCKADAAPVCKTGKPCGKACIAKDKVCHVK